MIFLPNLAVVLAALPALAAGTRVAEANNNNNAGLIKPDIAGGVPSSVSKFPFIVSLTRNGAHWCPGSLLNANTVLSVAHCFSGDRGANPSEFVVRAGSTSWTSGGVTQGVSRILLHPDYNTDISTVDNDLALLQLTGPIQHSSTIYYATLPPQGFDPTPGADVTVAGWGTTSNNNAQQYPDDLHELTVPIVERSKCSALYNNEYNVTTGMFCARGNAGVNECKGDSGGPAIGTSSRVLWGLASWGGVGDDCAVADKPGGYTNVGKFVDWIKANLF